jgi:hypothetical protein
MAMDGLESAEKLHNPEWYATDFIKELHLGSEADQKCERTCLLWSKEHWASEAKRTHVNLQQSKDRALSSTDSTVETMFQNAQFLNTVAQVYGKLFGSLEESCDVKVFEKCPHLRRRQELLKTGSLASVFVTILHKAVLYAELERHPIDSGLVDEEYNDVYGIDLTNFEDLEASLQDGRFETLYEAVLKRAKHLAGIGRYWSYW